jgi:predicted ArsR family transcriptional regulator
MGFVADVERIGDDSFVVAERNCPTRHVAEQYPQLCAEELRVYQEVTGAIVTRACRMADGGACCEYRISRAAPVQILHVVRPTSRGIPRE